jgi:hypothetical protein
MNRFSKELNSKIDGGLEVSKKPNDDNTKPKKKAPAAGASSKPPTGEDRVYVKVEIPQRALNQLLRAAGVGPQQGVTVTAKVSTYRKPSS